MVAIRQSHIKADVIPGSNEWLQLISPGEDQLSVILQGIQWCQKHSDEGRVSCSEGCEIIEVLLDLSMDSDSYLAAMLFPGFYQGIFSLDEITTQFGENIATLVASVKQMEAMHLIQDVRDKKQSGSQLDNIRKMLLTMVEDVRAIVIKLAERICHLHHVKDEDEETRVLAARESSSIYAPLANRLGIGQLKWELEDMSFRYLHPTEYKNIARLLEDRRIIREEYLKNFVDAVSAELEREGIAAKVYGRPKHIYSIYRKMQKKNYDFQHLYDIRAVRVIADRLQDCYAALGVIHTNWTHLHKEFDDYIATPKPNGYQSIHTVVLGPEGKAIEIQIRTEQMHKDAELGVAAHWKYKEGGQGGKVSGYDEKIQWLRKILEFQDEMLSEANVSDEIRDQVTEDRVYVFTPSGDIIDLPIGATPLDFAYYIHTNIGHRCIGAKVFGRIVPFSYELKTGDQLEILTQKNPNPSRDWLNPNLGYLRTPRARSKVATWFKHQDRDKNMISGKEILEQELNRVDMSLKDVDPAVERFNMTNLDDLLAAIGAGDVKINQVVNFLHSRTLHEEESEIDPRLKQKTSISRPSDSVEVDGVGNLMTHMANCCKPVPGDSIFGYITKGRGVAIHREDCNQFRNLMEESPERVVDATWPEKYSGGYSLTIRIQAHDRTGLLRDVTAILANEKINVLGMKSVSDIKSQIATFDMDIEIYNIDILNAVLTRLSQVNNVIEARRYMH